MLDRATGIGRHESGDRPKLRRHHHWAIPAVIAVLLFATTGCLDDAANKDFKFNNPVDPTPTNSDAEGELKIAFVSTNDEVVVIVNQSDSTISLDGWTLTAQNSGDIYTFSSFSLQAGRFVRLHSGDGSDDSNDLYWTGSDHWTSNIDTAELDDDEGANVHACSFNSSSSLNC